MLNKQILMIISSWTPEQREATLRMAWDGRYCSFDIWQRLKQEHSFEGSQKDVKDVLMNMTHQQQVDQSKET
jgi:hypothetical protein